MRVPRLLGGAALVLLASAAIVGAEPKDRATSLLVVVGVLLGAAGNVLRQRSRAAPATWRHAANGGWAGGVLVPLLFFVALGADGSKLGEAAVAGIFLGGMLAYGLGLLMSATGQMPEPVSSQQPVWLRQATKAAGTVLAVVAGMLISQFVRGALRASSPTTHVEIAKLLKVPAPHQARVEAAFDQHLKQAIRDTVVREALAQMSDEELKSVLGGTDALRRMRGAELSAWAAMMSHAYRQLDAPTCSSALKGDRNTAAREAMTVALGDALGAADSITLDHVAAGYVSAVRASARKQAIPHVPFAEGRAAAEIVFRHMAAEAQAFDRAANTPGESREPCRMVASLLDGALALPDPTRTTFVRFVLQGGE